jgi:hypothetical protein
VCVCMCVFVICMCVMNEIESSDRKYKERGA